MNVQQEKDEVIVYKKDAHNSDDDAIWDDTELIQAYNKAVGLAYNCVNDSLEDASGKISEKVGTSKKAAANSRTDETVQNKSLVETGNKKKRKQRCKKGKAKPWKVGDLCLAKFSEDGELYEAKIVSVDYGREMCVVRYLGYENEESLRFDTLRVISADHSICESTSLAEETADDEGDCQWNQHEVGFCSQIPVLPPPPPPSWMRTGCKLPSDQEALSSMLMAWYMSGYHTGYYQAQREMRASTKVGQLYTKNTRRNYRAEKDV